MRNKVLPFFLVLSLLYSLNSRATLLVDPNTEGGFENGASFALNNWTAVNAATNAWYCGVFTFNAGVRGAYIANDGAGANNNYSSAVNISHLYKDIVVPAGENEIQITFNWKCGGNFRTNGDYMRVYACPTTYTPLVNTAVPIIYTIGTPLANHTSWDQVTFYTSCYAGSTFRLVFSFLTNADIYLNNPAAAIDNVSVTSLNSFVTPPTNDLPCSATPLTLGTPTSGDNRCAGSASEPAAPACWTNGTINTVWYSVTCPASGSLLIRTNFSAGPNVLNNTQIALYSGTCGALVYVNCNDNMAACGSATYENSNLLQGGLTPGATYWIVVDGYGDLRGQFQLVVIDGSTSLPVIPGQDCGSPILICNTQTVVGDPGYQGIGNYCDFGTPSGNCTTGEKGSVWFTVNTNAVGSLMFTILPNDYNGVCDDETDYDFVIWRIASPSQPITNCATITSTNGNNEISCNYDQSGVTGLFTGGLAPAPYNAACYDNAFEAPLAVVAGETYLIVVNNFQNSQGGFTIDFTNATGVSYAPPTSVTWSGGASTSDWTTNANWGGCASPSCGVDATVTTASFYQPILTAGTYTVNNLTINAGASLTINAGVTLQICGNFTNNGNLNVDPTATIEMIGAGAQTMTGSFTGTNSLGHLTINKAAGSVIAASAITCAGNFLTSSATSIFNINGQTLNVAGNFTNNSGTTTFTGYANSTVNMNGTGAQSIGGSATTFYNLIVNKASGTCSLNGGNHTVDNQLTLTAGPLDLNTRTIIINNSATTAITRTAGYAISENTGNLNKIQWNIGAGTGSYVYPFGTSGGTYIPFTVNVTAATIGNVTCSTYPTAADNTPWPVTPQPVTNLNSTTSLIPDNRFATVDRFWQIDKTGGSGTATLTFSYLDAELITNLPAHAVPANQIAQRYNTGVNLWEPPAGGQTTTTIPPVYTVTCPGVTSFSPWALASNLSPLPIELVTFTGVALGPSGNQLNWVTASETGNDYFTLQHSVDGNTFIDLGDVDGAGTSSVQHSYEFIDEIPFPGLTYYRLVQTDFDETKSYSYVITVDNNMNPSAALLLYPNPTLDGQFQISLESSLIGKEVLVVVYDAEGREHYSKVILAGTAGGAITVFDPSERLSPGVYMVMATSQQKIYHQKLVVLQR